MSLTPARPQRCGRVAPMVIDRADGGYAARCLRCETVGPVRETSAEARRACASAHLTVEAVAVEARRRVRLNEGR